ncbi:MAG: NAD-dependent epimerase/dehydratase family protein [Rhizobiales bacterium]|nr:NAD-dependent epimerase/dehydratase family protein [Hyphomicrobiales bacterium]MBI3673405.1 NAD-dependent epimerase/dehydratase family protein [Hyphomicrobiales bacterium]
MIEDNREDRRRIVALTGATGFVGGHAVAELLRRGHRVRALVRNPRAARLPGEVGVIAGDLESSQALGGLVRGADVVVHMAGAIAAAAPAEFFRHNATATGRLAELAARAGVSRFIHISSLASREPQLSAYGASKRAAEDRLQGLATAMGILILRAPAIYGPGDRGTLPLLRELTRPVAFIPGRPAARFSLIHAADFARILAEAVTADRTGLREVSDGKSGGYGWADLIGAAGALRGRPIRPVFLPQALATGAAGLAEAAAWISGKPGLVNRGKVRELYHPDWVSRGEGWPLAGATGLAEGLAGTLAWYREAGWLPQTAKPDRSPPTSPDEAGP